MTSRAYRDGYDAIEWKPIPEWRKRRTEPERRGLYVVPDIKPYVSPLDGSFVGGRRQHRDHMRAHGVIEVGNEKPTRAKYKPLPPVADDIRAARQMLENGYRPAPRETFNPHEFD